MRLLNIVQSFSDFNTYLRYTARRPIFFPLIFIFIGCNTTDENRKELPQDLYAPPISVTLNTDSGYSINQFTGDSVKPIRNSKNKLVKTGVPIPIQGKVIDQSSITKPKILDVKFTTIEATPPNVKYLREDLKTINLDKSKLRRFDPSIDTAFALIRDSSGKQIPTGIPVLAISTKVMAKLPVPENALSLSQSNFSVFNIKYLDTYHGLKSSRVNAVIEDEQGVIWIAGLDGLSRYDGKYISQFTEKEGLIRNMVYSIMNDSKGNIWIDYGNGSISKFDGKTFTHFISKRESGVIFHGNNSMLEDSQGNIWFRNLVNGISRYDGKYFTHFTKNEGLSTTAIRCLMEDTKGNFWFGTHGNGVCRFDGRSFTYFTKKNGLNNDIVSAIAEDRSGTLWFGTDSGVTRYDGKTLTQFTEADGLSSNLIGSILEGRDGIIWLGSYKTGLTRFDGNSFTQISEKEGLTDNFVSTMMQDKKGNIWVCSNKGISVYKADNYLRHKGNNGPFDFQFHSVLEARNGLLWFGTNNKGLFSYDGRNLKQFTWQHESGTNQTAMNLMEDSKGNLWFTNLAGIMKFDGKQIKYFTGTDDFKLTQVRKILEDRTGKIWFAGISGIASYDGLNLVTYSENEGLSSNNVLSLYEDLKGNLWISTLNGGLSFFDGNSITHYTEKEGMSSNNLRVVLEEHDGNIWIGTTKNLSRFDGKRFTHISEQQGLKTGFLTTVLKDQNQNIWTLSTRGISRLSAYPLSNQATSQSNPIMTITNYSEKDGLKSDFLNGFVDSRNRLWLNHGNEPGLTMFELNKLNFSPDVPTAYLDHILINGNFINYHDSSVKRAGELDFRIAEPFKNFPLDLKLNYKNSWLTFYFHTNDQIMDEGVMYSYKMEGLDQGWSKPSSEAKADYRYIPPGTYNFQLRAINKWQRWGEPFEYRFTITAPFWQQWWFIALSGLFAITFTIWLAQKRVNSIRRREQEKTEYVKKMAELELQSLRAQLNPHFMFNSLNAIQELILMEENEKSQSYLARFAKLLRMLLENADKPFVPLQRELDFLRLYLSLENLRIPDLQHTVTIDPSIDTEQTLIPNMILQPYLENAIWHGLSHKLNYKTVDIDISRSGEFIIYKIKDNGIGRKKAEELKSLYRKEHKSKGMELLSKRFKLLAREYGSIVDTSVHDIINNNEVSGTMVTIKVSQIISRN